jgi:hypothetical protein
VLNFSKHVRDRQTAQVLELDAWLERLECRARFSLIALIERRRPADHRHQRRVWMQGQRPLERAGKRRSHDDAGRIRRRVSFAWARQIRVAWRGPPMPSRRLLRNRSEASPTAMNRFERLALVLLLQEVAERIPVRASVGAQDCPGSRRNSRNCRPDRPPRIRRSTGSDTASTTPPRLVAYSTSTGLAGAMGRWRRRLGEHRPGQGRMTVPRTSRQRLRDERHSS